ncbi:MAG TPA: class I SAM-dependent methyltransferase, partial [Anaerolineaceae bacterium]|nr:class I SAM-dependent methyltransferase [Anaerolineaceae bacterium]
MPDWDTLFKQSEMRWIDPHPWVVDFVEQWIRFPGARVLDLGCGAGRHLVYLARRGFRVTGLDVSPTGLAYAREWLEREGLQAELDQHDMLELPYPTNHFDALISILVIYHNPLDSIRKTIAEAHRVLRPGGMALLTFLSKRGWRYGSGTQIEADTFLPDGGADAGIPHHYSDLAEFDRELRGFIIRRVELREDLNEQGARSSHWGVFVEKPGA